MSPGGTGVEHARPSGQPGPSPPRLFGPRGTARASPTSWPNAGGSGQPIGAFSSQPEGARNGGADTLSVPAGDGCLGTSARGALPVQSLAEQVVGLRKQGVALRSVWLWSVPVWNPTSASSLTAKRNRSGPRGDVGQVPAFLDEVAALRDAGLRSKARTDARCGPGRIRPLGLTPRQASGTGGERSGRPWPTDRLGCHGRALSFMVRLILSGSPRPHTRGRGEKI